VFVKAESSDYHRLVWFFSSKTNTSTSQWEKVEIDVADNSNFRVSIKLESHAITC